MEDGRAKEFTAHSTLLSPALRCLLATPTIQIFGIKKSQSTRAAGRFFKERRAPVQFVDLDQRPMSPAEIKRFMDRFGWAGLLDTESAVYQNTGMKYLKLSETELAARVANEPKLLRLPLVRSGNKLGIGQDEESWKAMLS